jgi:hypothetical protein
MLSARLVRLIEDHAEELTHGVVEDLQKNPRTSEYHRLSRQEIHRRVYEVYHFLGRWLGEKSEDVIESLYTELGKTRSAEGVPLSEVIYALILTKYHLQDYIRSSGLIDSALGLYQLQELHRLVDSFFDRAIYYTTRGYEREGSPARTSSELAGKY